MTFLDEEYLLTASLPDLQHGMAALGPPVPRQPLLLGRGVDLPGRRPWPRMSGGSSQPPLIMASGPITSWEIDGETVETVADFILEGSKITVYGDCSHEIKRRLLLGRKVMTNLDSILKSQNITLPTKVRLVTAMVFPVVMCGCESWTVKKAEP